MATEFNVAVNSSGADYTSLSGAEAALQNDLTAATIKVFAISASSATRIADGETLVGGTSGATGTCVHVNVAKNQILIKTIAVAAFQSGEVVTGTSTNTVTLSNAGDSPIVRLNPAAFADSTVCTFSGWTTSATNYVRILPASGAEATMPYSTSRYRMTGNGDILYCSSVPYMRVERIQINQASAGGVRQALTFSFGCGGSWATRCLVLMAGTAAHQAYTSQNDSATPVLFVDCVALSSGGTGQGFRCGASTGLAVYCYNCTSVGFATNFFRNSGDFIVKNGLGVGGVTADFSGTFATGTVNCASGDTTAPGTSNRISQTFTFVNTGTGDYHLAGADAGAKGYGVDLSGDSIYPFTTDFDDATWNASWDIGAAKGPAGSALTASWAETALSLADSKGASPAKNVADTLTLGAAIALLTGKSLSDSLVIATALAHNAGKVLSESALSLADSITEALGTSGTDPVTLLDAWVVLLSRSFTESSLSLADAIAKNPGKVLTDTVPIGAAISISLGAGIYLSDAVVLSDGRVIALAKPITNAIVLGEAWDAQLNGQLLTAGWTEAAISLADARVMALSKAMADALNLLDVWKVRYHPAGGGGSALAADSERRRRFIAS